MNTECQEEVSEDDLVVTMFQPRRRSNDLSQVSDENVLQAGIETEIGNNIPE